MKHSFEISPETASRWLLVPGDWRRPNVEEEYEILWESERSFGQIWPRPKFQDVSSYYDVENYYTHGTSNPKNHGKDSFFQRLQTKISWLSDRGVEPDKDWWSDTLDDRKLRILEIGCGSGTNLDIFRALGHSVVGVEPDPNARKVAQKSGHEVYDGTAEALPPEVSTNRFDVLVFMHVLEHCIDPYHAILSAVSVLDNGGRIVAEVPNNACLGASRFGVIWHWLDVPRHLNFFTTDSLSQLFESAGLCVKNVSFRGYCRQFSNGWKSAQIEIADRLDLVEEQRPKEKDYWLYLATSMWADSQKKYDSVRIVAAHR